MQAANTIVELKSVTRIFRTETVETHALSGIDLKIGVGEFVSVSGPSGCGKSTLLAILGLLDKPSSGEYLLNNRRTADMSNREAALLRNRQLGFIFQTFNLIGDLSVEENVELPLCYRGSTPSFRRRRVRESLERVGMQHRSRHFPSQLSGGEQQRVAVARAIVGDPVLLLADEPTGNLDSVSGNAVMELLTDLHEAGSTIVMVTHDPRYSQVAERMVGLLDGKACDPPSGQKRSLFDSSQQVSATK